MLQTQKHVFWKGTLAGETSENWKNLIDLSASEEDKNRYDPEKIVKINVQDGSL